MANRARLIAILASAPGESLLGVMGMLEPVPDDCAVEVSAGVAFWFDDVEDVDIGGDEGVDVGGVEVRLFKNSSSFELHRVGIPSQKNFGIVRPSESENGVSYMTNYVRYVEQLFAGGNPCGTSMIDQLSVGRGGEAAGLVSTFTLSQWGNYNIGNYGGPT
jgi:hypothetical protein